MDSTPRLIDDLRAAGDVTEQVAEVGCQSDPGFSVSHSFVPETYGSLWLFLFVKIR